MIRFIDWFAGLGGFRHGLERANRIYQERQKPIESYLWHKGDKPNDTKWQTESNGQYQSSYCCVGACEIDKWCRRIYARNFGHEPEWGDSRAVDPASLPDFDLFCAGFPCQSFSVAGKRRGLGDPRGTLFFEIVRVCRERRPAYLLLENVRGLLSDDSGFTFETILGSLSEIGYDCQWEVLNSKHFGVPQNRERVFVVGHLRGEPRPQVFPLGEGDGEHPKTATGEDVIVVQTAHQHPDRWGSWVKRQGFSETLDGTGSQAICRGQMTNVILQKHQDWRQKGEGLRVFEGETPTLRENMGDNAPMVVPVQIGQGRNSWAMKYGTSIGSQDEAYVLRQDNPNAVMLGNRIRRLTPLECERLQGFPDGWTEGVSDTQRYRMLGNAVTANVIEAIGVRLAEALVEAGWTG